MQRSASLLRSVRPLVSPSATLQLSRQVSSIPSTSTTAEGIRQHGIDGFLPKESFENVEQWIGGLWNRLEGEMNCAQLRTNLTPTSADMKTLLAFIVLSPQPNYPNLTYNTLPFLHLLQLPA
jgi:hypothetical protein